MNDFVFLIRRELWEHRALYVVPLVFLSIVVLAVTIGILRGTEYVALTEIVRTLERSDHAAEALGTGGLSLWILFSLVTVVMVVFYFLDSLFADRKDRSVLFWKSLPVSDTRTVLSKLATGAVVAPLIAVGAALVTTILILVIASFAVMIGGGNPFTLLWGQFPFFTLFIKTVSITLLHSLWFLPFIGWLMFVSATARKIPFLLATLVPLAIGFGEKIAFDTHYFVSTIGSYAQRFYERVSMPTGDYNISIDGGDVAVNGRLSDLGGLSSVVSDPVFLIGLAIGAGFVTAAVVMRHRRVDAG